MKVYTVHRRQTVALPLEGVFAFFDRPENLERMTPGGLGFTILTPGPIVMQRGTLIEYVIRLMGMSMRWTTLITTYDPPHCFVDEQLRGPYSLWHHRHVFRESEDGTVIEDEVHYALRGGFLAPIIHALFVRRQIENIFNHRERVIARTFTAERVRVEP